MAGLLSRLVPRRVVAAVGLLSFVVGCGGRSEKPRDSIPEEYAQACWLTVPRDVATISEAMARTPSTGIVCIEPGIYTDAILLHDGISLRGTDDGVHLCGGTRGAELVEGVTLQRLTIGGMFELDSPAKLTLDHVRRDGADPSCRAYGPHGVLLDASHGGTLALTVDGGTFAPDGFWYADVSTKGPAADVGLSVKNVRCLAPECGFFARFPDTFPPGSSFHALLENNVLATADESSPVAGELELFLDDAERSELRLVHNTFFMEGSYVPAISLGRDSTVPVRLRGNALADYDSVVERGDDEVDSIEWDEGGNVTAFGSDHTPEGPWWDAWWVNTTAGDFHPAPGSPLIAAGGEDEPGTDALGVARGRWSDAGALEAIGSL